MAASPQGKQTLTIEISGRTFLISLMIVFGIWFILQIKVIILVLFISFILMSALAPLVDFFGRFKVPTVMAILFTYLGVLILLLLALVAVIPPMVKQTEALVTRLPFIVSQTLEVLGFGRGDEALLQAYTRYLVNFLTGWVGDAGRGAVQATIGLFSGLFALLTVVVVSFYLLLDRRRLHQNFVSLFPIPYQGRVRHLALKVERQLGQWMMGQLTLMLIVGGMSFVGLLLLRVPFALPLAIIAGLLEIVPLVGPILSAVPAVIIAAASSPIQGLSVVVLYTLVQQLENNLIVPQVMRRAVGLNPLIVIVALAIGATLMGVVGALLAVPTATVIFIIADELLNLSLEENSHFWTDAASSPPSDG
jgi:predicted PurR-regulated permease PerM